MSDRGRFVTRLSNEAQHWDNVARIADRIPRHEPFRGAPDVPDVLARTIAEVAGQLEQLALAAARGYRRQAAEHRRREGDGRLLNDDGTVR